MKFSIFALVAISTLAMAYPGKDSVKDINEEAKKKSTGTAAGSIGGAAGGLPGVDALHMHENGKKFSEGTKELNSARIDRMKEGTLEKSKTSNQLSKFEDGTGRRKARRAVWVRV